MTDSSHPAPVPHDTPDDAPITAARSDQADRALFAETVTIARPAAELYAFWRNPANLARVMHHILRIEPIDERRSRWTVHAPAGQEVSWESVITDDQPNESLTWQSAEAADVDNSGRIEFREAGQRGTVVRATIAYEPPAGTLGQWIAKLFGQDPVMQTRTDLRRFKQLMEAGEVATSARNRRIMAEQEGE